MIRVFELFCNLNQVNKSDLQLFHDSIESINVAQLTCPVCGAIHSCASHGSYSRTLVTFHSGNILDYELVVPRVLCSSCNHSHALLPAHLIPHGSYSLFFILLVLRDKFLKRGTVEQICERYQISPSTLYGWVALFYLQKELWLGVLKSAATSSMVFWDSLQRENGFLLHFFRKTRSSFLQPLRITTPFNPP